MSTSAPEKTGDSIATGRRKKAVARVRIKGGSGKIVVNGRPVEDYFPSEKDRFQVLDALNQTGKLNAVDVSIAVHGGGPTGQAGACKLGLARALRTFDTELDEMLRHSGLLTRDGRMKERKKYGLRGARRGTQFSKR
jgi:small subunit ribosomal protein S9